MNVRLVAKRGDNVDGALSTSKKLRLVWSETSCLSLMLVFMSLLLRKYLLFFFIY